MAFWKRVTGWFQRDQSYILDDWKNGDQLVYGPTTKNLFAKFQMFDEGTGKLHQKQLLKALNALELYPSKSQIYNMLKTSSECHARPEEDEAFMFVTFGDFCIYVSDLIDNYSNQGSAETTTSPTSVHRPVRQRSSVTSRYDGETTSKSNSKRTVELQITSTNTPHPNWSQALAASTEIYMFLGGSCNPTTWRRDTAIPMLKQYRLSFYNPQVEDWGPDMIEIEDQAKNNARLLLFVLEKTTRSIASMVEAAFHSGDQRLITLVIKGVPDNVEGEKLGPSELQDLRRGHAFLCDLVERQCLPIFDDLETAIHCSAKVLKQGVPISQLTPEDGAQPVRNPHIRISDRLINIKETFRSYQSPETQKLPLSDAKLALKVLSGREPSFPALHQIMSSSSAKESNFEFDFDHFCCLLTEFEQLQPYRKTVARWWNSTRRFIQGGIQPSCIPVPLETGDIRRDVFLGGSCRDTEWREEVLPLFRKEGLTLYNPRRPHWNLRFLPLEAQAKANSEYMFYVISSTARGIAAMVEVAHFIGQRRKVVLCIQHLKEGCEIDGEKLSVRSVRDYNRGRCYLADLASRQGTPIFDNVVEAAKALIARIKRERHIVGERHPSESGPFHPGHSGVHYANKSTQEKSVTVSHESQTEVRDHGCSVVEGDLKGSGSEDISQCGSSAALEKEEQEDIWEDVDIKDANNSKSRTDVEMNQNSPAPHWEEFKDVNISRTNNGVGQLTQGASPVLEKNVVDDHTFAGDDHSNIGTDDTQYQNGTRQSASQ